MISYIEEHAGTWPEEDNRYINSVINMVNRLIEKLSPNIKLMTNCLSNELLDIIMQRYNDIVLKYLDLCPENMAEN